MIPKLGVSGISSIPVSSGEGPYLIQIQHSKCLCASFIKLRQFGMDMSGIMRTVPMADKKNDHASSRSYPRVLRPLACPEPELNSSTLSFLHISPKLEASISYLKPKGSTSVLRPLPLHNLSWFSLETCS